MVFDSRTSFTWVVKDLYWVSLAAGDDTSRTILNNRVHVEDYDPGDDKRDPTVVVVATDGRRLHSAVIRKDVAGLEPGDYQIEGRKKTKVILEPETSETRPIFPEWRRTVPEQMSERLSVDVGGLEQVQRDKIGIAYYWIVKSFDTPLNLSYLEALSPGTWEVSGSEPTKALRFDHHHDRLMTVIMPIDPSPK